MIDLNQYRTLPQIQEEIKERMVARRKEKHFSQQKLAARSGVSLGSIKRFERTNEISLTSLLKIAGALEDAESFDQLFARQHFESIEEVIALAKSNT
ncbi:helix-turn-helix transcriptional regulator [Erysipelotrichaceae bacterium RD49]|nr:helix-turn-helix transcriptional regulator [Erysipelotrichaceae bacterium RD49]